MRSRADAAPGWIHAAALAAVGGRMAFDADDQHYLTRVCRAHDGDHVHLTDGRGGVAIARLEHDGRGLAAVVEALEQRTRARRAILLCGAPESGRADWLVEKLGELGIAAFQPVDCERGTWTRADAKLERWQRLASAALRQSRRSFLLEVHPPRPLAEALAGLPPSAELWLADPDGPSPAPGQSTAGDRVGLIGPASGFSDAERASILARGARPMCLSDGRLRTETAALAWAAWESGAGAADAPGSGSTAR